jgi:hypothetical protein
MVGKTSTAPAASNSNPHRDRSRMDSDRVHIFGVRHHGPGSARSLLRALEELRPDCVLVEGPPDADAVLTLAGDEACVPPVALLVYVPAEPRRAAFYPFASFSPEWQAIRYALATGVEVRFMDLPQWHQLAEGGESSSPDADAKAAADSDADQQEACDNNATRDDLLHRDPLGQLAEAAGYTDGERWWDALIESRREASGEVFAAVADAMATLREGVDNSQATRERQREAHMRKTIRAALKEGCERVAVVCGAWHAPALAPMRWPSAKEDNDLLKGLKKVKTEATWTPWTYRRLATASGYGAGVVSPAWYELLWSSRDLPVATVWMTRVARLMRERDLDASSAHVIEAVRLGETLAALRGRMVAGLDELDEAALSVLCGGHEAPMRLVREKLVIGDRLGAVPANTPMAPLQRDLAALQKRLRLPPTAEIKRHEFDLRKPNDRDRSYLLHRLLLLGIPWGERAEATSRSLGTFHEHWNLQWAPEFAVSLIEATRYGSTLAEAATAKTTEAAENAEKLAELTVLLGDSLLADLPRAVERLIKAIQQRASSSGDVQQLMAAVPSLASVCRYGDVRQTDVAVVAEVLGGIAERVCVALPPACSSLDEEAAAKMLGLINGVDSALATLQNETLRDDWRGCLSRLVQRDTAHAMLRGRAVRLRQDAGCTSAEEVGRLMSLAMSRAADRAEAAAWVEGFLSGSGMVLIHDQSLWGLIDEWLGGLPPADFTEVLPLLRRTFATFAAGERRQMGERVRDGRQLAPDMPVGDFDYDRAAKTLPLLRLLLRRSSADE